MSGSRRPPLEPRKPPSTRLPDDVQVILDANECGQVFTTARVRDGVIQARDQHRARLRRDTALVASTLAPLVDGALDHADVAAAQVGNGKVRIGLASQRVFLSTSADARAPWRPGDAPLEIDVARDPRTGDALWAKTGDRSAYSRVSPDCLLLGPADEVREGTWFHLAFHLADGWVSPPLGEGIIYGVTRARFMAAVDVRERPLSLDEVSQASDVVALSSLLGFAPVTRMGAAVFSTTDAFDTVTALTAFA